jgi:putative PIN family toxin of toxin-antitoxin system
LSEPLLVLDTNTVVRGMVNSSSASGIVLDGCQSHLYRLLLSKAVLAEYRRVLSDKTIRHLNPEISERHIERVLRRLKFISEYLSKVPMTFKLPRDPDDAKFLDLAIAGGATHIVTHDHDLLSLRNSHAETARRLRRRMPQMRIVTAQEFVKTSFRVDN